MEKEREMKTVTADHYYLARIAMVIVSIFHKNPSSLKIEDFILKFSTGEKEKPNKEDVLQKSKSVWAAMAAKFGFKKKEPRPDFNIDGITRG